MPPSFFFGDRELAPGKPAYIVGEMSANHHGSFDNAVKLLRAIKDAGADAVKLQTYTADTLTIKCARPEFQISTGTLWDGKTYYDLYKDASMPWEWQPKLKQLADDLKIDLFSSAFDATAVDFLDTINVPVHKIASFEIVDIPLIEKMARTGKPLILSTGTASQEEVRDAVTAARASGATQIMLLKCTSAYPSPPEAMHLHTIPHMRDTFDVQVGLSDHTMGTTVPVAAVALGAVFVEKHVTLARAVPGPDSTFSLEPQELKELVTAIRIAEKSFGVVQYGGDAHEEKSRCFRRSLFIVKNLKAGDVLTPENVRSIRPNHGLAPKFYAQVLGKRIAKDVELGTPLSWELVDKK